MNRTGKSTVSKSLFATINARRNLQDKILEDKRKEIKECLLEWISSSACSYNEKLWSLPDVESDELASTLVSSYIKQIEIDNNTKIDGIRHIISHGCKDKNIVIHDFNNICEKI